MQGFLAEGLMRTSAGLGSVIIDSQPLSVALMAAVLFGEELGLAGVLGMLGGVLGLCLLEVPPAVLSSSLGGLPTALGGAVLQLVDATTTAAVGSAGSLEAAVSTAAGAAASSGASSSSGGASEWSLWESGEWWMLLAAQSMAVGTVMVRWVARYCDPVVATGWHMILGGLPLLGLALAQDGSDLSARLAELTGVQWAALLAVDVLLWARAMLPAGLAA